MSRKRTHSTAFEFDADEVKAEDQRRKRHRDLDDLAAKQRQQENDPDFVDPRDLWPDSLAPVFLKETHFGTPDYISPLGSAHLPGLMPEFPIFFHEWLHIQTMVEQCKRDLNEFTKLGIYGEMFINHVKILHTFLRSPHGNWFAHVRKLLKLIYNQTDRYYLKSVINCQAVDGTSSMHIAVRQYGDATVFDRHEILRLLLQCGGTISIPDAHGNVAYSLAFKEDDKVTDGSRRFFTAV